MYREWKEIEFLKEYYKWIWGTTRLRGRPRNRWQDGVREDGRIVGGEGWQEKVCTWDDKLCLHCNILIYIKHIWIKPVLCSHMVSLFHHTLPWTHRCLQSSPVHIEMEEFSDVRFKQHAVIEFLTAEKVPPIKIHRRMQAVYGDQFVDVSRVMGWVRRFKDGELGQARF